MNLFKYCLLLVVAMGVVACGPNYTYETEIEIGDNGWIYQDSLVASFAIADTTQLYDLFLEIEHTNTFPYENFYLQVSTLFPQGENLQEQFSVQLAGKGGIWLGDCNNDHCTLLIPIRKEVFFSQQGDYKIIFEQFSRRNPLPGLRRIRFAMAEHLSS